MIMDLENEMNDLELLNLLMDMSRLQFSSAERNLGKMDLQVGQGAVITTLGEHGEMPQNKIAKIRKVSPATISVMIRRMEANGLVSRRNGESDAKVNLVSLTEKGEEAYRKMQEEFVQRPQHVFANLTEEDKKAAEHIFQTIYENLESMK